MLGHRLAENWPQVSYAIRARMRQLGLSQTQLTIRSKLSKAIVGELVHGAVVRNRSPRTLAALSRALEWHDDHLEAILHGERPPSITGKKHKLVPKTVAMEEISKRLCEIKRHLTEIEGKISDWSRQQYDPRVDEE